MEKRLGSQGIHEVKQHPLFAMIDWDLLQNRKVSPPVISIDFSKEEEEEKKEVIIEEKQLEKKWRKRKFSYSNFQFIIEENVKETYGC